MLYGSHSRSKFHSNVRNFNSFQEIIFSSLNLISKCKYLLICWKFCLNCGILIWCDSWWHLYSGLWVCGQNWFQVLLSLFQVWSGYWRIAKSEIRAVQLVFHEAKFPQYEIAKGNFEVLAWRLSFYSYEMMVTFHNPF